MKLLVVDDSSVIRARIARIAGDPRLPGIEVVGLARNGVEAVALAQQTRPDIVTMDLTMPEMDGVTCIGELLAFDSALRIVVVSALSDRATALLALKKGAQSYLHKPFDDEHLVATLLQLVR